MKRTGDYPPVRFGDSTVGVAMEWSAIFAVAAVIAKIHANNLLDFAMDYTLVDTTGRIRVCNFATCWGTDNLLLIKEASSSFRCSVVVKSPEMSISEWYIPGILQLFVVDLNCLGTKQLLKEAESLGLFNDNVVWLVMNSKEGMNDGFVNGSSAMDVFKKIYVTVLSQVNIAKRVSPNKIEITSLYRRNPNERIILENLGYWTKEEGVVFTRMSVPSARRANTEGRLFKGAGVITNDDSLNHFYDVFSPEIDNPTKIYYVLWENMIQAMNGRMEFVIARKWGAMVNGSFDGMMGFIERNEAEIPVSPLYITEERLKFVRYLAIGQSFRIKLLFLSPPLSYKNNIYLLPFSSGVWYSCIFLLALSVVLLYIVAHFEDTRRASCDNPEYKNTRSRALTKSWIDLIMLNFGTVCQQDLFMEPKGVCGRIIILHVKILVLFVSVFYSASILVLLQSSDSTITNLKALDESNFKIASDDTPYNRFYLKELKDPIGKAIVAKISNKTGFMSPEEGINKVKNGFFAFHVNRGTGYLVIRHLFNERDKCRLQELDESLLPNSDPLMAVKRDLPYRETISVMFQRIYERGFIHREGQRKSAGKPPCEHGQTSYVNIGVVESKGAFELLVGAFLLSFMIFLGELFVGKRKERKMKDSSLQFGYYD